MAAVGVVRGAVTDDPVQVLSDGQLTRVLRGDAPTPTPLPTLPRELDDLPVVSLPSAASESDDVTSLTPEPGDDAPSAVATAVASTSGFAGPSQQAGTTPAPSPLRPSSHSRDDDDESKPRPPESPTSAPVTQAPGVRPRPPVGPPPSLPAQPAVPTSEPAAPAGPTSQPPDQPVRSPETDRPEPSPSPSPSRTKAERRSDESDHDKDADKQVSTRTTQPAPTPSSTKSSSESTKSSSPQPTASQSNQTGATTMSASLVFIAAPGAVAATCDGERVRAFAVPTRGWRAEVSEPDTRVTIAFTRAADTASPSPAPTAQRQDRDNRDRGDRGDRSDRSHRIASPSSDTGETRVNPQGGDQEVGRERDRSAAPAKGDQEVRMQVRCHHDRPQVESIQQRP